MRRFLWDDQVIPPDRTHDVIVGSRELREAGQLGLLGVRRIDDQALAGFTGLWPFRDPPVLELLYGIAESLWGQGYATEAAGGVLEVARLLGHRRIHAGHFVDNPASGRVLRKLGFMPTGVTRPRMSCARGQEVMAHEYALDLDADAVPQMWAA